ncbi:uncharacterized protein LOC34617638 [Cyclospora cayetanensis]|uniref:Uncharacterized protein LOC34617638 n=2 Tax=Cyclospora cayetanensis TaxID=88456 RepID=A0A6P5WEV5_9EIME|nr:uncharacterized protein LOC34617638 [Cyclospora cayetanensis]OEH74965.1 deoxyuridine 5-triphosphate related protein [Cyclospora cayetanensis]
MPTLQILPLREEAKALYAGHGTFHDGDSGLDLFIVEQTSIAPGETKFLKLGFAASMRNEQGRAVSWLVLPRSSISKTPLRLANSVGLIDAGYRGELMAAVDNVKSETFTVKPGDRYFQAVAFNGEGFSLQLVDSLDETSRGSCGYGSTGVADKGPQQKKQKAEQDAIEIENAPNNTD